MSAFNQVLKQCYFCGYSGISERDTECPNCHADLLKQNSLLPIGHTLFNCQYRIERVLGQGGFGITYLAYDVNLHRQVAIKEFFPQHCVVRDQRTLAVIVSKSKAEFYQRSLARFEQEGRILAKLNHRGIVNVFCLFRELNTCYLVMELLQGHTLAAELEARNYAPVSSKLVQKIIHILTDALALTHAQGILHLDIKPDNIVLTYDGRIVLLDFGAARWEREQGDGNHPQSILAYTPEYAPLELIQGDELGVWTDIYELGLLAYELLTGKRPPDALKRLRGESDWQPALELPHPWGGMVEWATYLHPPERPPSVREWWDFGFSQKAQEPTRPANENTPLPETIAYKLFRYFQVFRLKYRYYFILVISIASIIFIVMVAWYIFSENSLVVRRNRAERAFRAGRLHEAITHYDRALQMAPENPELYEARAGVRSQLQDHVGAIADYKEALRLTNNAPHLQVKLAEAFMNYGDYQQSQNQFDLALGSYEQAVSAHPGQKPLLAERIFRAQLGKARKHSDAGEFVEATQIYESLLQDKGLSAEFKQEVKLKLAELLFNYGESMQKAEKFPEAIKLFSLAIQQSADDARFYAARGFNYLQMQKLALAKADLDKAIALDGTVATYYAIRAEIKGQLQSYLSAIADYNEALKLGLDTAEVYLGRGILYMEIKNYKAAVEDFNRAIVKDQANFEAYLYRGWSLYHLQSYNQAILDFNEALRLSADNPSAYEGSGYVKFYLLDRRGAKSDLIKAKELYHRQSQLDKVQRIDEFLTRHNL